MTLYIVRHADAKSRSAWEADDRLRPLTKKGERQAAEIAQRLASAEVQRVLSSPAVRCLTTVAPLAKAHGVDVHPTELLFEGAAPKAAYQLVLEQTQRDGDAVLCAHGDLIPEMLRRAAKDGAELVGGYRWAKGSTWALSTASGAIVSGRYQPPPD
ncbi:MAG: SixA phosphatase family protein [Acidimicrobiales bacterium]